MRRLHKLLKMNGQERYDALQGHDWDLTEFLAQSRAYMRPMPGWRFWPKALFMVWPKFRRLQVADHESR